MSSQHVIGLAIISIALLIVIEILLVTYGGTGSSKRGGYSGSTEAEDVPPPRVDNEP